MLLAYGFLRKVFEIFENHKTSVDMVTTSEVSVSVTIDNIFHLENILADLSELGLVEHHKNQSLVCVVGDSLSANRGNVEQVFAAVRNVPIRMISYGAAKNSISFLVDGTDKINTLEALNSLLPQSIQTENHYA
jgi:aspartate kinase